MKRLVIGILIWLVSYASQAGYLERVLCYCVNNGYSNVAVGVDFSLRDDGNGVYIDTWNLLIEKPTNDQLPTEEQSTGIQEIMWQNNKSDQLKFVENVYVNFLTNQWTTTCRSYGLIPTNYIISVDNINEFTTIQLLKALRSINFDIYDQMAGEFDRLKNFIIANGGIMNKIKKH